VLHSFVFHKDCTLFERRARCVRTYFSARPQTRLPNLEAGMLCDDDLANVYIAS
jgi:hypothetical protein